MTLISTFIPDPGVRTALASLWRAYDTGEQPAPILLRLRIQLGPVHYSRFEKDLVALMEKNTARTSVYRIAVAAIERLERQTTAHRQIRELHQLV